MHISIKSPTKDRKMLTFTALAKGIQTAAMHKSADFSREMCATAENASEKWDKVSKLSTFLSVDGCQNND